MKFKINQKDLYQGIQIVQKAVASKQTMPILTGIYMEASKDRGIHLIGTDLELGIEHTISEAEVINEGSIVIPANNFSNLVRELPKEKINFAADLDNYEIKIECLNSKFELKGYDPNEYPQLPEINIPKKMNIETDKLQNIIKEVEFSTATDETQPALTGALLAVDNENGITMVSTNTYRLAYSNINITPDIEESIKVILPGKTLNELNRLLEGDNTEIEIDSNYASFKFNDITVISRLIEGQFPNYQQVMPNQYNTRVTVDKNKLKKAVKRASLIARMDSNIISLKVSDERLIINSANSDTGHAHEEVAVDIEGPEQNINIDAGYLLDVLKIIDRDEIILELIGPLNPLSLKKTEEERSYTYLIMPVRSDS